MRLRRFLTLALLPAALAASGLSHAQVPTDRGPLRLVVGFPAGGSADVLARTLADQLRSELSMPVVVENRAGAGGQIAAEYVKAQAADGLTVLLGTFHMMVMVPLTSKGARYGAQDFKALGRVGTFNEAVTVPVASPVQNLGQWLELARKDTKVASYGVPAPGSLPQFIGYQLAQAAQAPLVSVPYKGTAPLTQDLLAGQVGSGVLPIADVGQYHGSKLRVLAVNGVKRSPRLPEVPTLRELGYTQFDELEWTGLFVPSGTAPATLAQLQGVVGRVVASPQVREMLLGRGTDPDFEAGDALDKRVLRDMATWGPVIKASGFTAE